MLLRSRELDRSPEERPVGEGQEESRVGIEAWGLGVFGGDAARLCEAAVTGGSLGPLSSYLSYGNSTYPSF